MKRKAGRDIRIRFGIAVRKRRSELGISQEELAARAELHRTYIADIERGTRNVSLLNIEKITNGLGLSIADLAGRYGVDADHDPGGGRGSPQN
jgi:transcriptional regulator with XRE-family HTH domain